MCLTQNKKGVKAHLTPNSLGFNMQILRPERLERYFLIFSKPHVFYMVWYFSLARYLLFLLETLSPDKN